MLDVVATDATFDHVTRPDASKATTGASFWTGKCIHCNTRLIVAESGETDATLEHIRPLCAGGSPDDPRNLALACSGCNSRKGIDHDRHVGKGGRADQVIRALEEKRASRWREPMQA